MRTSGIVAILVAMTLALLTLGMAVDQGDPPPEPCATPISYRLGSIDPRFGMSKDDLRRAVAEASAPWNAAAGRELFAFDPQAEIAIELVYDWRQETTQKEKAMVAEIESWVSRLEGLEGRLTSLKARVENLRRRRQAELETYNARVDEWNARGGAPRDVLEALMAERQDINAKLRAVEGERVAFNRLVAQHNALVDKINARTAEINADGLAGTEFMKGAYIVKGSSRRVVVYQFRERSDLLLVLGHELGHVLGLAHTADPDSVMSPLLKSETVALSNDDRHALAAVCSR